MKQLFMRQNGSMRLILFFCGYGQDERPFPVVKAHGPDLALVYDYEDSTFDCSVYEKYQCIDVVSWSMGVMMAAVTLGNGALKVRKAVAVNGTIEGIDDEFGIATKMWNATEAALCPASVLKFYRRMCGVKDAAFYLEHAPARSLDGLRRELAFLKHTAAGKIRKSFHYSRAYVGLGDRIIPAQNQLRSWNAQGVSAVQGEFAHFPLEILSYELEL
ncbi:MAG: DUF452 family protein [Succinivibrio sp.]|nr:DUF452 family protein [Succinivibrio sp.]